ncbi:MULTISPECIES: hypothetical protein [Paraburkholderia]|uniref:Uncharacterized protein n=1 Tax=Paraburkholderia madseniana TaxID=2599607 RepID=A0AAP5BKJ5_9BURK|nr:MULTISPECIES: hypothetical protein [Paraburkholderia]MCX4151455.1 hypothetical protein [Paraburkholderia madseniana]MDN7154386.1 hypothetical protein [Paraburkholderia sp. WS6]MDQ6413268.1 hypothetical protein [Paraburkholderia madseniana]
MTSRYIVLTLVLILVLFGAVQSPAILQTVYYDYTKEKRLYDQAFVDREGADERFRKAIADRNVRAGGGGEGAKQQDLDILTAQALQAKHVYDVAQSEIDSIRPQVDRAIEQSESASGIIRIYALGCLGALGAVLSRISLGKQDSLLRSVDFFRSVAGIFCGGFAALLVYAAAETGVLDFIARPSGALRVVSPICVWS